MPLSNIFLWIMLVLAGLLGYQLLVSLMDAESKAARATQFTEPVHDVTRFRNSAAIYNERRKAGFVCRQVYPANAGRSNGQPGFMTIAASQDINSSKFNEISFFLPYKGSQPEQISNEKMAAGSDCHYCA